MPRINLNLSDLTAARAALENVTTAQRRLDVELARAKTQLDAAVRAGESPNVTVPLQESIRESTAARAALVAQQRGLRAQIDALANNLLLQQDPARLVESMDGRQPIALLPMRIETRYVSPDNIDRLRIRVYPDDLNTIEHVPALTEAELQGGTDYWNARFKHDDDEAARVLRDLSLVFGRGRAAWIVRTLTPLNNIPDGNNGDAPNFPEAETIDARAKATRAVLLPDRWCAIGFAAGRREIFRVWGNRIPDELLLSPDWQLTDAPEALLGGDRAWMVDFDAALANGMALEVTQGDVNAFALRQHAPGFNLATGTIERLLIVGLEWTKSAADSAADLADLLAAHRDSTGLGFVPLGTPTNNTEAAPAGHSPASERTPPPPPPAPNAVATKELDALQLLLWAFGLSPDQLDDHNIANAHLAEQRTALHMMNVLFRGTFGHYLMELWNPQLDEKSRFLKTPALYALRRYAVSYLRASGALPLLRVNKQPYGILPMVGKRFVDSGGSSVESNIAKILSVLRPMWQLASANVPLLTDGDLKRAQDILQTAPWSQKAFYRDRAADKNLCNVPNPFSDAQLSSRGGMIRALLAAVGINNYNEAHLYNCSDFQPDPPYSRGDLIGVPWVMANPQNPALEAAIDATLPDADNYLAKIGAAAIQTPAAVDYELTRHQAGPALLQSLVAFSVQKEQNDAVGNFIEGSVAVNNVLSLATSKMTYVENQLENEAVFTVHTSRELENVVIPSLTGRSTLAEHVANTLVVTPPTIQPSRAHEAASALFDTVAFLAPQTRDLGAVKLSLDYLKGRSVGELNVAFRTTLDAFSYRLDAWITARANRRLEQLRERQAAGVYVGGFAWVENLRADSRPGSDGYLLAPSVGQAATAALLRSGFAANHEHGAFDIALDSQRTRRALDILQGLGRDQPLAALYGYRIERGLRDSRLGKFIWPLRLAFPWRPVGANVADEPKEAIGARDVVDGVALMDAWETDAAAARVRLTSSLATIQQPAPLPDDLNKLATIMQDALDLRDSVMDLLLAEGTHQIVQGNLERAGAAMNVIDKQALPIETQVQRTPRGGASYTQRLAVLCPNDAAGWPDDRRARAEPGANAWLAAMLGDPARYRFTALVHRRDQDGGEVIDGNPIVLTWQDLGLSPLSAVLLANSVTKPHVTGASGETGFRERLVAEFVRRLADPNTVTGLDIKQEGDASGTLGLGHFEALAMTFKGVLDKARPITRKDIVRVENSVEKTLPHEGEYPGIDLADIQARAAALIADFDAASAVVLGSVGADALLASLAAFIDFLPVSSWQAQVFAIDATQANPAGRDARAAEAVIALTTLLTARHDAVHADVELLDGQVAATHGQLVQQAIERIKLLLGKDFPVVPRCRLGPYAAEFNASLVQQNALTLNDAWRITGWLTQVAHVRDGADHLAAALSAHEALCAPADANDFMLVQFPHRDQQVWAALPEAWREPDGTPFDPKQVPEELQPYLTNRPGIVYKDIQRVVPDIAIALHTPGGRAALVANESFAGLVCDQWPEFIPDPFQTAGIAFHYDAPGARPPQAILLALPPRLDQDAWTFDDVLDVIHESFDLAKLRGVRPSNLDGGLGALLPANYLPQTYTNDLPSVQLLEMLRRAREKLVASASSASAAFVLGKV